MTPRQLLVAVAVGGIGILVGVAVVGGRWTTAPAGPDERPPAAPESDLDARSAGLPAEGAPPAGSEETVVAATPPPAPDTPPATPGEIARWRAEEPVALHAARDAHRWLDVAWALHGRGERELEIRARTCAARLERTLRPQPEDEVRDTLLVEVELLRELSSRARDDWQDDDLLALLQDIEMGAHHALQGAPPPEDFDQPVVPGPP